MKKYQVLTVLAALSSLTAQAQIDYTGGTYSQNFDAMPSSGTVASPFSSTVGVQGSIPGATEFKGTKAGGTGTSPMPFTVDNGSANSGALYSYGETNSSDRALGTLASGSNVPAFGVELVNNTPFSFASFTLTVSREQWRSSTQTLNTVIFEFGTSGVAGVSSGNFLTQPGFTPLSTFDLVGASPVATNGLLDGNANSIVLTGTIPVSLDPGQSLFLRWTDTNDTGSDAGLAIDNFSITGVPEPSTYVLLGFGLLLCAQRFLRRKNA